MSVFSNVIEQDLINLRKLGDQQKEQRAIKFKIRILKQTHDRLLAESRSPITKLLDTINKSTQRLGEIVKESNTPQLAVENTHTALPIEKDKKQPGVIYDTPLENTLNNMKK